MRAADAGRLVGVAVLASILLTGCTGTGPDVATPTPTAETTALPDVPSSGPGTPTRTSITPVTPDGLLTGPGVDDTTITIGLIVDPAVDRGFSAGARLWQTTVNGAGICGRTVQFTTVSGSSTALPGYESVARRSLGLITLPSPARDAELAGWITHDQLPAVTPVGRSADLDPWGPMVIGATDDILAINAAAHLVSAGTLTEGAVLGVATDGSPAAADAEAGLRWYAEGTGLQLDVRDAAAAAGGWPGVPAIIALGGPELTAVALRATPPDVIVTTTLAGYQPAMFEPSWAGRLLVAIPTTAPNSDHPGAEAVMKAYSDSGGTDPGPMLFAGFAVGSTWGRLLEQACSAGALTRTGVRTAAAGLGPASPDSLLGATDLAVLVDQGLPATRSSAIATADPSAPGGLAALTWLTAAPGIAQYVPAG